MMLQYPLVLALAILGTAMAQQLPEEVPSEVSNLTPKECMFPPRSSYFIGSPENWATGIRDAIELIEEWFSGKASKVTNSSVESSSDGRAFSKKAFFAPVDFTEEHFKRALENYPQADRLIIKEKIGKGVVIAPGSWGSRYLTFKIRSRGDQQVTRALQRFFCQNYGGDIAKKVMPLLQERIATGYPLSATTLRQMLLHAELLARCEVIPPYLMCGRELPYEGEKLQQQLVVAQSESLIELLKSQAGERQKSADETIANLQARHRYPTRLATAHFIDYIKGRISQEIAGDLQQAILASEQAAKTKVNLLLLDYLAEHPGALESCHEEMPPGGLENAPLDEGDSESSRLLPQGETRGENYGAMQRK